VTIVETRVITGGVDTHADMHVAAALDPIGGLLGVGEFPVNPAGYTRLLGWLGGFGTVALAGVEGTGSYGAGPARHITAAGIRVVEAARSDRQDRRRQGKSDPLDAVSAARAAQSGRPRGAPKGRDGAVEAIRALMGRQAQRPLRADPDDQPGQVPDRDPDPVTCARGSPGTRSPPWSASWRRCGPAPVMLSAEIHAQRARIGELLGQLRDTQREHDTDAVQRLTAENATLKQRLRDLPASRLLDANIST
jgi:hypothetical protein